MFRYVGRGNYIHDTCRSMTRAATVDVATSTQDAICSAGGARNARRYDDNERTTSVATLIVLKPIQGSEMKEKERRDAVPHDAGIRTLSFGGS
jgi:hypothetical protein